jgi:DNA-binding transcriptional MerR regulator
MYTIGRLAKRFHLSRSALLYYDSIGLLNPSCRTEGHYRVYSEKDAKRLEQICTYRQAGLRLEDIKQVLDSPENSLVSVLERRLDELNEDVRRLRGFTEEEMVRWHVEFERLSPEKHERFLRFLCIPDDEIQAIKSWRMSAEG